MIRKFGKTLYACAYSWSGASRWKRNTKLNSLPFIVGYHRVVENFERSACHAIPPMLISAGMLTRHLEWLAKHFEFVSLDDIGLHLEGGRRFGKPAVAITFDDGYGDVYRHAYPILRKKGIPAAVFAVTDLVGTTRLQLYDKLYLLISRLRAHGTSIACVTSGLLKNLDLQCPELLHLRGPDDCAFGVMTLIMNRFPQSAVRRFVAALEQSAPIDREVLQEMASMTWEMIEEMHRNGFTIGSHTLSHALLTGETLPRIKYELLFSKEAIESRLGATVKHFAYPDGRFNSTVVKAVAAAGYRYGYGICHVRDREHPILTIPRKVLWEKACVDAIGRFSPVVMHCQTSWAFDDLSRCEHDHGGQACQGHLNTA
jgi:peptidoglycan/xylan/chitin deacetylase (PgdA/CDA1 family)